MQITPMQVRGARAMLGWSLLDLARASGVSVSTVKRIETLGAVMPSGSVHSTVTQTLEQAGATFLVDDGDGAGVRLRRE